MQQKEQNKPPTNIKSKNETSVDNPTQINTLYPSQHIITRIPNQAKKWQEISEPD